MANRDSTGLIAIRTNFRSGRYTLHQKICPSCKSQFEAIQRRIYCSTKCYGIASRGAGNPNHRHGRDVIKTSSCPTCGILFSAFSQIYCSRKCVPLGGKDNPSFSHGRAIRREKPCERCSALFVGHEKNRFCSRRCKGQWNLDNRFNGPEGKAWREHYSKATSGSGNGNWRGGRALVGYQIGWTKPLRIAIKHRDGNRCVTCKGQNNLVVHHRDFEKSNHSPSNLITLCRSCHGKVHAGKLELLPCNDSLKTPKAP